MWDVWDVTSEKREKQKKKEKIKRREVFRSLKEIVILFDVLRVWKSVMSRVSMPKSCREHQMKEKKKKKKKKKRENEKD